MARKSLAPTKHASTCQRPVPVFRENDLSGVAQRREWHWLHPVGIWTECRETDMRSWTGEPSTRQLEAISWLVGTAMKVEYNWIYVTRLYDKCLSKRLSRGVPMGTSVVSQQPFATYLVAWCGAVLRVVQYACHRKNEWHNILKFKVLCHYSLNIEFNYCRWTHERCIAIWHYFSPTYCIFWTYLVLQQGHTLDFIFYIFIKNTKTFTVMLQEINRHSAGQMSWGSGHLTHKVLLMANEKSELLVIVSGQVWRMSTISLAVENIYW